MIACRKKNKRPGLYRAVFDEGRWETTRESSDSVLDKPYRMVAIADRREEPEKAADDSATFLIESPISTGGKVIKNEGFDLHFTPGDKTIGGWVNIRQAMNAERDPELRESAVQLAYTMARSKKTKSVSWVSVQGGSGVLTQAMRILKDNGVSFKGNDHSVFFSRITTLSVPAERLARDIGLKFDRETKSYKYSPSEIIGGTGLGVGNIAAAWNRYQSDANHTALQFGVDVSREVSGMVGGAKRLGDATIAGGIALGIISATGAAASAFPPAVAFALAAGGAAIRSGPAAIEALFPHFYNKTKKRL